MESRGAKEENWKRSQTNSSDRSSLVLPERVTAWQTKWKRNDTTHSWKGLVTWDELSKE